MTFLRRRSTGERECALRLPQSAQRRRCPAEASGPTPPEFLRQKKGLPASTAAADSTARERHGQIGGLTGRALLRVIGEGCRAVRHPAIDRHLDGVPLQPAKTRSFDSEPLVVGRYQVDDASAKPGKLVIEPD